MVDKKAEYKSLDLVAHTSNPSTQKVEAGGFL